MADNFPNEWWCQTTNPRGSDKVKRDKYKMHIIFKLLKTKTKWKPWRQPEKSIFTASGD